MCGECLHSNREVPGERTRQVFQKAKENGTLVLRSPQMEAALPELMNRKRSGVIFIGKISLPPKLK